MRQIPDFFYFDLGNVLINFSHERAAEQMAAASGAPTEAVWRLVFEGAMPRRLETGQISSSEFCREFRQATGSQVSDERLLLACSDIFWLNAPIVPLVSQLVAAGFRLGILSNTCQAHWDFVWRKFRIVSCFFPLRMLSFESGAMKPDPSFFTAAMRNAASPPERIFFVDDRPEHVQGAIDCGLDAVRYTTVRELGRELSERGVSIHY